MTWENFGPIFSTLVVLVLGLSQFRKWQSESRAADGDAKAKKADAAESITNAALTLYEPYQKEVEKLRSKVEHLEELLNQCIAERDRRVSALEEEIRCLHEGLNGLRGSSDVTETSE